MEENKQEHELNDEDLRVVTGGTNWPEYVFSGHVGKYDGVVGEKYYIVCDYKNAWAYGELVKTWEKHDILWMTIRTHRIDVKLTGGECFDHGETEYSSTNWTLYTTRVK